MVSRFCRRGQIPPAKVMQPAVSYPPLQDIKAPT